MNISSKDFLKQINKISRISPDDVELCTLAKKYLQTLKNNHDEFLKEVKEKGYNPKDVNIGLIEVRFFTLMKTISEKLGLPVDKYEEQIRNVEIRVFGEKNCKQFF